MLFLFRQKVFAFFMLFVSLGDLHRSVHNTFQNAAENALFCTIKFSKYSIACRDI